MQAILISEFDDRWKIPGDGVSKDWATVGDNDTCLEIAMKAGQLARDEDVVLFISLELSNSIYSSTELVGAQVLEYIRFTETFPDDTKNKLRDAHCVIYSISGFESTLRKNPEQTILFSPGTSFLGPVKQEPFDVNLEVLVKDRFNRDQWVHAVRTSTFIETDNHSVANWWGVHRLAQVHTEVTGEEYVVHEIKPEVEKLGNLRATAFYSSGANLSRTLLDAEKRKLIEITRERIFERKLKILHIDDEWNKGWTRLFATILFGSDVKEKADGDTFKTISNRNGAISVMKSFTGYSETSPQTFADKVFGSVLDGMTWSPNCIFLDLRLAGDKESGESTESLSGVLLLRLLREQFKGIPVIMTTASNKAWSIAKLLQAGADAYWIKESLRSHNVPNDSVEAYTSLLQLVDFATDSKYEFLREFAAAIEYHLKRPRRWYVNPHWGKPIGLGNVKRIDEILNQSVSLLRMYLHGSVMNYEYRSSKSEAHLIASLVTHSFHAVEIIHNPDNKEFDNASRQMFDLRTVMDKRKDHLGNRLRQIRNNYAHLNFLFGVPHDLATFDSLRSFLISLFAYLEVSPQQIPSLKSHPNLLNVPYYSAVITRFNR